MNSRVRSCETCLFTPIPMESHCTKTHWYDNDSHPARPHAECFTLMAYQNLTIPTSFGTYDLRLSSLGRHLRRNSLGRRHPIGHWYLLSPRATLLDPGLYVLTGHVLPLGAQGPGHKANQTIQLVDGSSTEAGSKCHGST